MPNIVWNARIQLLATLINTMAAASFTVGVASPIAAAFIPGSPGAHPWQPLALGVIIWLLAAQVLHSIASFVLGRLRG